MKKTAAFSGRDDTICALSTPHGMGAIAVVRASGRNAVGIIHGMFRPASSGLDLRQAPTHTLHLGELQDQDLDIDQVVVGIFRAPNSYTGEDVVEISCHGSLFIQQRILEMLTRRGMRLAGPGEFTLRAFLNGKLDLSQAEAVADLIASGSRASHAMAMQQMRGGYSRKISELRKNLLELTSLIELELDFSEEELEFADRSELRQLCMELEEELGGLVESFSLGNVLKKGIPVAIIGKPNVGKSSLLNAILNEDRALVSEIPGTTRDSVEDLITIDGISFRFIDTAGLRDSGDQVEAMGIERTYQMIREARIILYVFDVTETEYDEVREALDDIKTAVGENGGDHPDKVLIPVANKTDLLVESPRGFSDMVEMECLFVSAKRKENINLIIERLAGFVRHDKVSEQTIVSNARHAEAFGKSRQAVRRVINGLDEKLPTDLLASELRDALHHIGTIIGEITTEEILDNIFSKFCIGK
ncbi:MAG: tRNA uridine-5-carboxymethylaminomethyl(34) synthesis GTPase MnmE [Bacteroidales bacterium]|nr:tRNA uridine-5-carboxymethylaminomethyl(34) synthesis GTPase MnmE [Bacteroidales bacterium]